MSSLCPNIFEAMLPGAGLLLRENDENPVIASLCLTQRTTQLRAANKGRGALGGRAVIMNTVELWVPEFQFSNVVPPPDVLFSMLFRLECGSY